MKKVLMTSAALICAATIPALADTAAPKSDVVSAHLTASANANQVRQLLSAKNYTNISDLNRDESGRWYGTAVKDGKRTAVSVILPSKPNTALTN